VVLIRRVVDERTWLQTLDARCQIIWTSRYEKFGFAIQHQQQLFFKMRVRRMR